MLSNTDKPELPNVIEDTDAFNCFWDLIFHTPESLLLAAETNLVPFLAGSG